MAATIKQPRKSKLNLSDPRDQNILEAYLMACVGNTLKNIQMLQSELEHGKFVGNANGVDVFDPQNSRNPNYISDRISIATEKANAILDDVRGSLVDEHNNVILDENDRPISPLRYYFNSRTRANFELLKEPTKKALELTRTFSRRKFLKDTKKFLDLSRPAKDGFTLTDTQIDEIERVMKSQSISLKSLEAKTNKRYRAEKLVLAGAIAKRFATLSLAATLLAGAYSFATNTFEDIQDVGETNSQTFETLIDNGYSYDDFNISVNDFASLLSFNQTLENYAVRQPSSDAQLELVTSMQETYNSIINSKLTALFEKEFPDKEISNINYGENGEVSVNIGNDLRTFTVRDLKKQNANLQDLIEACETINSIKTEIEADIQSQSSIDNNQDTPVTEYDLSQKTLERINKLSEINTKACLAASQSLDIRDHLLTKDEILSKAAVKSDIDSIEPEISMEENETNSNTSEVSTDVFSLADISNATVLNHFKEFYCNEYNKTHQDNISSSSISILESSQSYAYLVNVGDKTFVMTHGSYPAGVREFLDNQVYNGTLTYQGINGINITQVIKDANVYDDNGNHQDSIMLDGAATVDGKVLPVISGNFFKKVLDKDYSSIISDINMYDAFESVLDINTPYSTTEHHINEAKKDYISSLNAYCQAHNYTSKDEVYNPTTNRDNRSDDTAR